MKPPKDRVECGACGDWWPLQTKEHGVVHILCHSCRMKMNDRTRSQRWDAKGRMVKR